MLEFDEIQYKHDWQKQHIYVDIALGNTCSFSCSYCSPELHDGSFPWHSIDNLKKFIDKLFLHYTKIHNKKYFTFNFLGGEPSLYKNLTNLCEYIRNKKEKYNTTAGIEFLTNGYRKLKWWRKYIHLFDNIVISHHAEFADPYHTKELGDLIVENNKLAHALVIMMPDQWEKCIDHANIILTSKYNNFGVSPKILVPYVVDSYNYTLKQLKIFNTVFREDNLKRPFLFRRGSDLYNNNLKIQELSPTIMIKDKINCFKNWHCYAGIDTIHVNHQGEIFSGGGCPIGRNSNLHDSDYNFPSNTVICPVDICSCSDDIETRKWKYE